jgi:hypothetical protein
MFKTFNLYNLYTNLTIFFFTLTSGSVFLRMSPTYLIVDFFFFKKNKKLLKLYKNYKCIISGGLYQPNSTRVGVGKVQRELD